MKLLTTQEASDFLGGAIKPDTLRKWASDGRIEHYKLGGKYFFTKEQTERILIKKTAAENIAEQGELQEHVESEIDINIWGGSKKSQSYHSRKAGL